ncbi:MAG: type CRISPR-associated protein Cas6/Cmx6 [Cyanobacteriota bacterium]|jgi:CRISPR-associated endonuclease/helicase Cas3
MIDISYVDVVFPLKGRFLPLDNGYLVYSALSDLCPNIHKAELDIGIHPIAGKPNRYKQLKLTKRSKLKIRIALEQIPLIYQFLVEQTFKIGASQFHIGIPEYKVLTPASSLYSRLVIIRRSRMPQDFIEAAQRQLERLGITGEINLLQKQNGQLQCRQLVMRKEEGTFPLIGYGVEVTDLSESDSIKLQQQGIGGKRKMMCGVFVPSWRNHDPSHDNSQPT